MSLKLRELAEMLKYTGVYVSEDGSKFWLKNGICHRENGPAIEYKDGAKYWCLENYYYQPINLKNYVVLDQYQGKYGILWYKLLDKDKVIEYPDIPGLIKK